MAEPAQQASSPHFDPGAGEGEGDEQASPQGETLPVLAAEVRVTPARSAAAALPEARRVVIPAVHAAAVAAGSFVAGAAVVGLVHRRQRRASALVKGARAGRRSSHVGARSAGKTAELVQIVSSRSLLVDVHLLGGPGER